jgi:2-polyprenyl-3-methyl-5-hydroxy-6-metoxy-1,4-benzoquinol methylase
MKLPDLDTRHLQPELMDAPDLAPARAAGALRALARVNRLSGVAGRVWDEARALNGDHGGRPIRVLDVACGGGDVVVSLARRASRSGLALEVHGCDVSPTAIAVARDNSKRAGVRARFFELDALRDEIPDDYDVVCCSLFLHHLEEHDAVALLVTMAEKARRTVLVQDLRRTAAGYALAFAVLRLISRSDVAHTDGSRSVEGAFSLREARDLARRAGLEGAVVEPCWPQRFRLTWRRHV